MKKSSRYVFGAALAGMALGGIPGVVSHAHAALVTNADFTFDSVAIPSTTASTFGPYSADSGTGSAYATHVASTFLSGTGSTVATNSAANTPFASVSGNGSAKALTASHWGVGDFYQFNVPTTAIMNVIISFDQLSSGTGPHSFSLLYSNDGGADFSTLAGYTLVTSASQSNSTTSSVSTSTWATGASFSGFNYSFALPSTMDDQASAVFQLVDEAANTATGTAGTDRIDNVVVAGTAIVVPEPATFSLLTAAASAVLLRRRRTV
jgi:hypothetical protein